jgi:hypothetical protein
MEQPRDDGSDQTGKWINAWGFVVLLGVVAIWGLSWVLIDKYVISTNPSLATNEAAGGVFGDKFGAVNALFSGLAFTGVIWALILQRHDLRLQREEIAEQKATLQRQRFETTLFQLIALHSDIVEKLLVAAHHGRDAFTFFIELLKQGAPEFRIFHALRKLTPAEQFEMRSTKQIPDSALPKLDSHEQASLNYDLANGMITISKFDANDRSYHESIVNAAYTFAHEKSRDGLSHYFRNLYHIFKFIDEAQVPEKDKIAYARIVRAQLSDEELVALYYNCITIVDVNSGLELGYPKMTYLVNKYKITHNINKFSLIHERHAEIYDVRVLAANAERAK